MVVFQNPAQFRELVYSFQASRIILTAYELGIFTVLSKGPQTSAEVAAHLKVHARACDRLMNALVPVGLIKKENGIFSNEEFAEQHLVNGKPGYIASLAHTNQMWKTWSGLTQSVRTGKNAPRERVDPDTWVQNFIAAMHDRAVTQAENVVQKIDLKDVSSLLDVGGGSGVYSMAFIRAKEGLHATVFDLPEVVVETKKYVQEAGLESSFSYLAGDYNKDDFGSGYDLIFLSAIVHINSYDENVALITKCAQALKSGGQVVIQDHVMEEDRTAPAAGAFFALNMLVGTDHGDTYTEKEMLEWFEKAGLVFSARVPTMNNALIIGRKR